MYKPSKYVEYANKLARKAFPSRIKAMGERQIFMTNAEIYREAMLRKEKYDKLLAQEK